MDTLLEGIGRDRIIMGKLKTDIDLLEEIRELAIKERIQAGILLSGIGALKKAIFRNVKIIPPDYKLEDRHRLYLEIEQPLELVSLNGWIAAKEDGGIEVHAHLSASTVIQDRIVTLAGHLTPGTLTSIKTVISIGIIENSSIRAALDNRINQFDIAF
jgi:uncharacterized protein